MNTDPCGVATNTNLLASCEPPASTQYSLALGNDEPQSGVVIGAPDASVTIQGTMPATALAIFMLPRILSSRVGVCITSEERAGNGTEEIFKKYNRTGSAEDRPLPGTV